MDKRVPYLSAFAVHGFPHEEALYQVSVYIIFYLN